MSRSGFSARDPTEMVLLGPSGRELRPRPKWAARWMSPIAVAIVVAMIVAGLFGADLPAGMGRALAEILPRLGLSLGTTLAICGAAAMALPLGTCVLFGLLMSAALWRSDPGRRISKARRLVVFGLMVLADLGFLRTQFGVLPSFFEALLAVAASTWGIAFVFFWQRSRRAFVNFTLLSVTSIGLAILGTLFAVSDVIATVGDGPSMTEEDRDRLRNELERISEDRRRAAQLVLAEKDLDLVAGRCLRTLSSNARVDVRLGDGVLWAEATVGCPPICFGERYLNFDLHLSQIENVATLDDVALSVVRVGGVSVPGIWVTSLSRAMLAVLRQNSSTSPYFGWIVACRFRNHELELTGNIKRSIGAAMTPLDMGLGGRPTLAKSVQRYTESLVMAADATGPGDDRFVHLLRSAFQSAHERTRETAGRAADENRAALIAFGLVVGNASLRSVAGLTAPEDFTGSRNQRVFGVTLRQRNDWARHFATSAALTLLSSEPLSRTAGELKEEFDAGIQGSGYSFADLLADEAGVRFAAASIRDEASAARMQETLIAGPPKIDDLFPSAIGLPEGISATELQQRYGGVGGPEYLRVEREIARRLDACPLLH